MLSRQTLTTWPSALITATALALLFRFKTKEPILVALGAAAGLALHWPW